MSSTEGSTYQVELEVKAVEDAIANADNKFTPTPSLLNSVDPNALLQQVDGPDLTNYEVKESVYVGMSVPVALRAISEVPIHVTAPGSIVEYSVETKNYDILFGVLAEREEGVTIVKVRVSWSLLLYYLLVCRTCDRKNIVHSLVTVTMTTTSDILT